MAGLSKPPQDYSSPLMLHKRVEAEGAVTPKVKVTATDHQVNFHYGYANESRYNSAFQLRDEAAVRTLRDILDAWLEAHGEDL